MLLAYLDWFGRLTMCLLIFSLPVMIMFALGGYGQWFAKAMVRLIWLCVPVAIYLTYFAAPVPILVAYFGVVAHVFLLPAIVAYCTQIDRLWQLRQHQNSSAVKERREIAKLKANHPTFGRHDPTF